MCQAIRKIHHSLDNAATQPCIVTRDGRGAVGKLGTPYNRYTPSFARSDTRLARISNWRGGGCVCVEALVTNPIARIQ